MGKTLMFCDILVQIYLKKFSFYAFTMGCFSDKNAQKVMSLQVIANGLPQDLRNTMELH